MSFYKFVLKLFALYSKTFYKYEVIGAENVPDEGNIILAANHKSALDPIFVSVAIKNREVSTIAKKELFKAIDEFPGSVILVSHDRDFYSKIVDFTFDLEKNTIENKNR